MTLISIISFLCCSLNSVASSPTTEQTGGIQDTPTAANFLRRAFHGSTVLGDFVYVDGGEISQLVDGIPDPGQGSVSGIHTPYARQNNVTLSIDLRKSWTNSSLVINTISKGSAPILNSERPWKDPDGKSFYLWNGALSALTGTFTDTPNTLWKFTGDGTGDGTWSQEPINYTASSSASQRLLRPGSLGSSVTLGDTGYYIGGRVWQQSDVHASAKGYFQNTTTSFNISSGLWNNELYTNIGSSGTIEGASAGAISALGLDGRDLMIVVGGRDPGTNVSQPPANYSAFDNVTLYDPYIDVWYAQKASGDIPASREEFCAVTVRGDNGTYEIFIYGGLNGLTSEVYDDVYVLTIPGFVWFKAPDPSPTARFSHTCEFVGGRQLLSIGGLDNPRGSLNIYMDFGIPDPFVQGLGVFDMTDLVWKSMYDANAPPYESSRVVKTWYSRGNQATVQWQSLELARMFIRDIPVSVSPTPAATVSGAPTATGTTQNNDQSEFKQSLIGTSATLGSLVVALVGLLIGWKQLRRMKAPKLGSARRDSPELSSPDAEPKETHHESSPAVTSNPNSSSPASAVSTA